MDLTELNDQQRGILKQFRENVNDCQLPETNDVYLLRWLVARDFDMGKAEKMLRYSLECRKNYQVNDILDWKVPQVFSAYYPMGITGFDKYDNMVWIVAYGRVDIRGLLQSAKKRDYMKYVIHMVEKHVTEMSYKVKPTKIFQQTVIFDVEFLSMRDLTYKPGLEMIVQIVQYYEANYPELLHRAYVVNASSLFAMAWKWLKPFLDQKTASKVQIFNSDKEQWKAAILEDIDPSQIPAFYGGSMTDPDGNPQWLTKVCMGGEIPNSYYLPKNKPDVKSFNRNIHVYYRSKEQLEYDVYEAGSVLRWKFCSEDGDIKFAVYHKKDDGVDEIVPRERIDCLSSVEEGEIKCIEAGQYLVEFDNTYSLIRSKKIWYDISIVSNEVN